MDELTVSASVWLPVGRSNFYSSTANGWLHHGGGTGPSRAAESTALGTAGYVPRLQVSVLRRVLEVLPVSFGYHHVGVCEMNDESDDLSRPVAVTMTLRPDPDVVRLPDLDPQRLANLALVRAGVETVTLRVDEHGGYTFRAGARVGDREAMRNALLSHMREVFGGAYSLDRRGGPVNRNAADNAGSAAVRRYQGTDPSLTTAADRPRGILTFFQLNTLVEGLFNESLAPAVFFEQNDLLQKFLANPLPGALTLIEELGQVIGLVSICDIDAGTPEGLVIALRRFLDVTAREVLQKLKWSVESVRRSLLDESVGMLHRQSKLVQLNLGALADERTPELAEGASESQLRGYVMLAAAKLPLVTNVLEIAELATDHLAEVAQGPASAGLPQDVGRLKTQLAHWRSLLRGLRNNIGGLEHAIEHAWRENLLYEQQQVRREQEGMAEIERSRAGRPTAERASKNVYNFLMLVLTAAAVLLTVKTGNILDLNDPDTDWLVTALSLWPIAVVAVLFYLIVPLLGTIRRIHRDRHGESDSYPYEFAFRLQETADSTMVREYLNAEDARHPASSLSRLTLINRGGGRIERVSDDRALVKMHSIATFQVSRGHYARFEIVNEILSHRVSGRPTHAIVQCRMFGDSPKALTPGQVFELITVVLNDVGVNLTTNDPGGTDMAGIRVDKILELIGPLFTDSTASGRGGSAPGPHTGTPAPVPVPRAEGVDMH